MQISAIQFKIETLYMFPRINIFIDVKDIVIDINPVDYAVKITHILPVL